METLTVEHIAPYLPYKVKCLIQGRVIDEIDLLGSSFYGTKIRNHASDFSDMKLIIRPLSDLSQEIEVNGEKFVPIEMICKKDFRKNETVLQQIFNVKISYQYCEYWFLTYLFEWHFDVFGLIAKGLAIDINTIN